MSLAKSCEGETRRVRLTRQAPKEETQMATPDRRIGGISVGGILVIAGLLIAFIWSFVLGLIVAVIGLVAFGGFVRGKWY
jgi:hypothetical protein